ncbi:MAG: metal-sulfur cluster assembly factor [Verrucomicrobia bacterium]|nr:metal-sulfur cluster assembly factor [Verrucomicrobiota bacterium]
MSESTLVSEADVLDALREVIDPELDCNLVDLGLIYGVRVEPGNINVEMTLTTPGCPMHESLLAGVKTAISNLPGVKNVNVDLVWDPPWNPEMLSPEGRAQLGMFEF